MSTSQIQQAVKALIQPMEVVRDKDGCWTHPGIPDFEESAELWNAWKAEQGIETTYVELDDEDDEHPVRAAYFDNGDPNVSAWNPAPPAGDGWFIFSIHDTEDGPVWVWARRVEVAVAYVSPFNPVEDRVFRCVDCCAKAGEPHAGECPEAAANASASHEQAPARPEGAKL